MKARTSDPITYHESQPIDRGIPLIGDKFPETEVQTTHGRTTLPADLSGRWFVLISHSAAYTPECKIQFAAYAKRPN